MKITWSGGKRMQEQDLGIAVREKTIDVYLSKTLSENLYVLQYPVRPSNVTYDSVEHLSARVKPNQKKIEIELGLNTKSPHYARSKGEQIALNVDGGNVGEDGAHFNSSLMDKQILSSAPCPCNPGRYAVGLVKEGELHLTPVHALVQLRPSFNYLDKVDSKQKADLQAAAEGGESSQDEAEEDAKPVTVKFSRPESDEAKARRLASYDYLHKMREEESWVPIRCYNVHDEQCDTERSRLVSGRSEQETTEFHVQPADYLHMLMPPTAETEAEKPCMPHNQLSLTQLKTMPLGDQVKALLTNARVIRFNQLMTLLPQGTDPEATLRSLQHVAVMVQGCWVVKSEILYPKDACSPHSGIKSEHLCRGRDYVMWRYTQSRCVTRKEIASVIKFPNDDVKDILEQMSRIKINQGWEFVFEHDYDFTDSHPEIAQRQKMLWDAKYQALVKHFNISKEMEKKIKEQACAEPAAERPRRRRHSSRSSRKRTLSGRSISDHSDIEMDPLKPELEQEIEPMDTVNSNHVTNGPTMEVAMDSEQTTLSSVPIELKTELVNFVQEKLYSRFVLSLSELKRLFSIKLSACAPGHILGTGVSDKLLEETVIEVGGRLLDAKWQQENVFILSKTGDELDPLRGVLVDLLKENYKINKRVLAKKIEADSGMSPSDNDCKSVLRDYCVVKSGTWYIKCCSEWT